MVRFRKSKTIGGLRITLSKSGLSASTGIKGLRVGVNSRGTYTSTSIPGSGLYSINYMNSNSRNGDKNTTSQSGIGGGDNLILKGTRLNDPGLTRLIILLICGILLSFLLLPLGIFFLFLYFVLRYRRSKSLSTQSIRLGIKAKKLLMSGKLLDAISLFQQALNLDKENENIIFLLGVSFYENKEYDKAIERLLPIYKQNVDNYMLSMMLAKMYVNLSQYDNAIPIVQSIINTQQDNICLEALLLLSDIFVKQGKYDLSIETLKKAPLTKRKLNEDLLLIHYKIALSFEHVGDKKNALKHYKRIYATDANYNDIQNKINNLK